jgi:hypothetical protein
MAEGDFPDDAGGDEFLKEAIARAAPFLFQVTRGGRQIKRPEVEGEAKLLGRFVHKLCVSL